MIAASPCCPTTTCAMPIDPAICLHLQWRRPRKRRVENAFGPRPMGQGVGLDTNATRTMAKLIVGQELLTTTGLAHACMIRSARRKGFLQRSMHAFQVPLALLPGAHVDGDLRAAIETLESTPPTHTDGQVRCNIATGSRSLRPTATCTLLICCSDNVAVVTPKRAASLLQRSALLHARQRSACAPSVARPQSAT